MTNFQDVLRDVHDPSSHALKTTASLSASTVYVGTPTLYAVVNTGAAGDSTANIGFATVSVSNPTLYAVVNTSAPGVGNSIVTVANTPLDTQIVGNVTLSGPVPTGANWIGIATVWTANAQTNTGNVTLNSSPNFIGITTVANKDRNITGNVTLSDSKTYVGLTTSTLGRGHQYIGLATVQQVGLVTVVQSSSSRSIAGNLTLSDSKGFIGLVTAVGNFSSSGNVTLNGGPNQIGSVTVSNPITVGNAMVTVTLGTKLDSTNDSVSIGGTPTVFVGTPTLYAVVNTAAAGVGNSIVTVANTPLDTQIVGNVTLSDSKTFIGLVSVSGVSDAVSTEGSAIPTKGLMLHGRYDSTAPASVDDGDAVPILTDAGGRPRVIIQDLQDNEGDSLVDSTSATLKVSPIGNVTLSDSKTYIGLVTATSVNGGTNKTLIHKNIELSTASLATVYVATETWKATHLLLNSNATVRVSIKSGATYLTGNASIGITLNPGGGWVENGSPDSPIYQALAVDQGIVVEKLDLTGTVANVGGKIMFYDE